MANYHSRGTYNAPEQMSLYGDGVAGRWTYSDSYRAMLDEGRRDIDLDFCVPSTTLVAYMMKVCGAAGCVGLIFSRPALTLTPLCAHRCQHLLLFEPRDDNSVWVLKGAPRRFYAPNSPAVTVAGSRVRYGTLGYQLNISDAGADGGVSGVTAGKFTARLEWDLHGRGYVPAAASRGGGAARGGAGGTARAQLRVLIRLRDHDRSSTSPCNPKVVHGACVVGDGGGGDGGAGGTGSKPMGSEAVVVTLLGTSQGVAGKGSCTITASLC